MAVVEANFDKPDLNASPCAFSLKLPTLSFSLNIPFPDFPPPFPFPIPMFRFALSCDLNNPIDIAAGVKPGGGRKAVYDPDPDDSDT